MFSGASSGVVTGGFAAARIPRPSPNWTERVQLFKLQVRQTVDRRAKRAFFFNPGMFVLGCVAGSALALATMATVARAVPKLTPCPGHAGIGGTGTIAYDIRQAAGGGCSLVKFVIAHGTLERDENFHYLTWRCRITRAFHAKPGGPGSLTGEIIACRFRNSYFSFEWAT